LQFKKISKIIVWLFVFLLFAALSWGFDTGDDSIPGSLAWHNTQAAGGYRKVRVTSGTHALETDLTLTSGVYLDFEPGALIQPASGITLTINGGIIADSNQQIFDMSAGGSVTVGAGVVKEIYPEWFGAIDGTADQVQINAALNALPAGPTSPNAAMDYTDGGTVKLSRRNWVLAAPIMIDSFQVLEGSGPSTVLKNGSTSTAAIQMGADDNAYHIRMGVRNLTIQGPAVAYAAGGYGIHGYAVMRGLIENVWINDSNDDGIKLEGSSYTYIKNCDVSSNYGYGINLVGSQADAYLWTTSTHIQDSTIQLNHKAGIKVYTGTKGSISNCTIESNGFDTTEYLGYTDHFSPTAYYLNVYLYQAHSYNVHHNYFENNGTYGTAATRICIANAGSEKTRITYNDFITDVGLLIWASLNQAPWYNYIANNEFLKTMAGNMVLAYEAGETAAYYNSFRDNKGMRVSDQDSQPYKQDWTMTGIADGLRYSNTTFTHTTSATPYAPDLSLLSSDSQLSGQPKARIHIITLQDDISIVAPTPTGVNDFILTFIFIQDGTGGRTVSFDSNYKEEWSDTGNTAGKISTITFYGDSTSAMYQLGAQSGYY